MFCVPRCPHAQWNETFVFLVESGAKFANLEVSVFDHNIIRADEPIGTISVSIAALPRGNEVEKYYTLQGVASGEVLLKLKRIVLTSDYHRDLLRVCGRLKRLVMVLCQVAQSTPRFCGALCTSVYVRLSRN